MTQRMIEITSPFFVPQPQNPETVLDLTSLFENDRRLALEIGCGIGDFIVQLAHRQPDVNFLAIDIYNKGCYKTCRKIELAGLTNIRVIRAEARYLMTHHLGPDSLTAIYINCPDPWPKKRHRNRRLVNRDFLRTALYCLRPGGDLCFSTDFDDYADDVAALLPTVAGYRNVLDAPRAAVLPDYPLSKYMRRFLQRGQQLHFIHYRKDPNVQVAELSLAAIDPGFRRHWRRAENA